jgi:hypothetical protein
MRICQIPLVAMLPDLGDIDHGRGRALDPSRRHDAPVASHTAPPTSHLEWVWRAIRGRKSEEPDKTAETW